MNSNCQRYRLQGVAEDSSTEKLRLFVAIAIPDPVREEIIRVQRELQPLAPRDAVRWTKPEQFHLTLRFLGDVSADRVAALKESVRAVCSGVPAVAFARARRRLFSRTPVRRASFGSVSATTKTGWRICKGKLKLRSSRLRKSRAAEKFRRARDAGAVQIV